MKIIEFAEGGFRADQYSAHGYETISESFGGGAFSKPITTRKFKVWVKFNGGSVGRYFENELEALEDCQRITRELKKLKI